MKLVFTPEAERQVSEMDTWWREHRPKASNLFARELAEIGELLSSTPTMGSKYVTRSGKQVRRVLMPKTRKHLYFEIDEDQRRIVVLAVWGAPRGSGPYL